jgi:hypothetical protein
VVLAAALGAAGLAALTSGCAGPAAAYGDPGGGILGAGPGSDGGPDGGAADAGAGPGLGADAGADAGPDTGAGPADAARSPFTLTPALAAPGGAVDIHTRSCGASVSGTVTSRAFDRTVTLAPAADGGLYAEAQVSGRITSGSYAVFVSCDGTHRSLSGNVTITTGEGSAAGSYGGPLPFAPVPAGGGAMAGHPAVRPASASTGMSASLSTSAAGERGR